jgi:hypothetical protein
MDFTNVIETIVEWKQIQRDFAHALELLHATLVWVLKSNPQLARSFAAEFERKLAEMPEGWRIAQFLRELDSHWGYELECNGLRLDGRPRNERG